MGIFVLVCSFELRGVKAGAPGRHSAVSAEVSSGSLSALASQRSLSKGAASLAPLGPPEGLGSLPGLGGDAALDNDAGSVYGADAPHDFERTFTPGSAPDRLDKGRWEMGPLVMMMILLHIIYPSFPISPQVEVGRIMSFLGFLWSVGTMRCICVVNTEPMHKCMLMLLTVVGVVVHAFIFLAVDTINDLIFPDAASSVDLYQGPRYLQQLLQYIRIRYPTELGGLNFGPTVAWCVVSAVVFSSAVWKEFLFRGVYLGGLRTQMPFWAANVTTALIYALAHEPLQLSSDGSVKLQIVSLAPLLMGSMWYGYLYHKCNNLLVTVSAHLLFNAGLLALHLCL